jgi:hypothetical protein
MVRAGAPKPFWADAIELEAYVHSNTAHDIFILQGEVPETVMSGETSDISQFCEFTFYDWIMFRDQPVAFPDDNPVLGCYLGPAIDVGPALTAKILKANGEVVYRSTYCALTDVELANAAHVCRRIEFDLNILDKFGQEKTKDDFLDLDIPDTPELNSFDDLDYAGRDDEWVKRWRAFTGDGLTDDADDEIPSPSLGVEVELPTPEAGDNYVNASLMLPRGNSLARGTVIGQKTTLRAIPSGTQTPILSWIHAFIALNLTTATFVNSPRTSSPSPCTHLAMRMATNTFFSTLSSITKVTERPSRRTISGLFTTVVTHFADPLLDGICVSSGRMDQLPGNLSRI